MSRRGGVNLPLLRQELVTQGVRLVAAPRYRNDVSALRAHSDQVIESLARYEVIENPDQDIRVQRECQGAVIGAVKEGSLLITGEPGSGKSAVLNTLARQLQGEGHDVVVLAVDRYSVESLEGLSRELKLDNAILDVLDAWDGPEPAWLIIDALDATRGGKGEGAFRTLIGQVLERGGRWRVVASIRTFDLRMGQQFRALFRGAPPVRDLAEPGFGAVRHIRIPEWSATEFAAVRGQSRQLDAALVGASDRLLDLARIPFNTRLITELVSDASLQAKLADVATQAQLLRLYWDNRVTSHGVPALGCLHRVVSAMVESRALRASTIKVAETDPAAVDALCREGVLIRVEDDRWVQFRHHLLFDYSAAQLLFEPSDIVSGARRFPKEGALGLMLAPALTFLLQEIWSTETNHARFWTAIANLVSDSSGDPIIRSAAGRQSAEYPKVAADTLFLAERIAGGDDKTITALNHIAGAVAVRLEDEDDVTLKPWVPLIGALAPSVDRIANVLRFMVMLVLEKTSSPIVTEDIGRAARALLAHGLSLTEVNNLVVTVIPFVVDTYVTDAAASRELLGRVFERERMLDHGWEEVPAVCRKIAALSVVDPAFAAAVYAATFSFSVTDDRKTRMGSSQILALSSNARQDYGMAYYALNEHIETFLRDSPTLATAAILQAVEGFVARAHPVEPEVHPIELIIGDQAVTLRPDRSFIWAHDIEAQYRQDAEVLIAKFYRHLKSVDEPRAIDLARYTTAHTSTAVVWGRLFMAATERGDGLIDYLWPFAANSAFLTELDTRKDAVDVVVAGFDRRSTEDRAAFEASVLDIAFPNAPDPAGARASLLSRIFGSIGRDRLISDAARAWVPEDTTPRLGTNERLFRLEGGSRRLGPYEWIDDLDQEDVAHTSVIAAIETVKETFGLETAKTTPVALTLDQGLGVLDALLDVLDSSTEVPENLITYGQGVIAQACDRLVNAKLLVTAEVDGVGTGEDRFLRLLRVAVNARGPEVDGETERQFEEHQAWGSPAPRVDAAQAVLDTCLARPDLYPVLAPDIDRLLADSHPAVRLQAGSNLVRIWDVDRDGFWRRLGDRLDLEANLGVLQFLIGGVIGNVLHADPARTEQLIFRLLARFADDPRRLSPIEFELSDKITILWVTYERPMAHETVNGWIIDPTGKSEVHRKILSTLRDATVAGLRNSSAQDAGLRHRSQQVFKEIVDSASLVLDPILGRTNLTEAQVESGQACAGILDVACQELYFASGIANGTHQLDEAGEVVFLAEIAPTLMRIGDLATPRTVYNLLQLVEGLVDAGPEAAFDIAAHALLTGGTKSGYQFDHMGVEVMVRLVGVFLADHKDIFEVPARRAALIDCLETFMEAGWPAARRLLYRLPELIQ